MGVDTVEMAAPVKERVGITPANILFISPEGDRIESYVRSSLDGGNKIGEVLCFDFLTLGDHPGLRSMLRGREVTLIVGHVRNMMDCAILRALSIGQEIPIVAIGGCLENRFLKRALESKGIPCFVGLPEDCIDEISILIAEWIGIHLDLRGQPIPMRNGKVDIVTFLNLVRAYNRDHNFSNN